MFQLLAGLLAFFYGLVPNYAVAIALLTLTVMLVLSPLTLKSTRSMLAMQRLQPEAKRIQQKYKGGDRQQMNQEMMALYKEHQVNPVSGCLPMLVQIPVLFVMYQIIRGLTQVRPGGCEGFDPKYLGRGTQLFQDLCSSNQEMVSFGVDLSKTASEAFERSIAAGLPLLLLVGLVIFVQYYQSKQMTRRSAAAPSPQMQMMTRVMPVVFGVFSFAFPAALNVYFVVSGLFRVGQQGAMYRWDPTLAAHAQERDKERAKEAGKQGGKQGGGKGGDGSGKANGKKPQDKRPTAKGGARGGQPKADGRKPDTRKPNTKPSKPATPGGKGGGTKSSTNGRPPKSSQKAKGGDRARARKRRARKGR